MAQTKEFAPAIGRPAGGTPRPRGRRRQIEHAPDWTLLEPTGPENVVVGSGPLVAKASATGSAGKTLDEANLCSCVREGGEHGHVFPQNLSRRLSRHSWDGNVNRHFRSFHRFHTFLAFA